VVNEIVHAHGAHVEVIDNGGSGARFIVALPTG
jgi:signal transduction histidine kinase